MEKELKWFEKKEFLEQEESGIHAKYPRLNFISENGRVILKGDFGFSATYNNITITDSYSISVNFPDDFPKGIPSVVENGYRIPDSYHKNPDKTLCLSTPAQQYIIYSENRTILNYVDSLVLPYLYRFSFLNKYGYEPFPEYSHGVKGIVEFYREYFEMQEDTKILKLLYFFLFEYKKSSPCPCGSGLKIAKCHAHKLLSLQKIGTEILKNDLLSISNFLKQNRPEG